MSIYANWALDQRDATNNVDWSYCYDPSKYDTKCADRGMGIPPPPPKPLTYLVTPDTTTTPAPALPAGWGGDCSNVTNWVQEYKNENPQDDDVNGAWIAFETMCPVQAMPMVVGNAPILTQSAATSQAQAIATTNAAKANATVAPTASAAPPPALPTPAPNPLPSTGVIVGAAVGLAALLMLV